MAIKFSCGSCGQRFQATDRTAGNQAKCPTFGRWLMVPVRPAAGPGAGPPPLSTAEGSDDGPKRPFWKDPVFKVGAAVNAVILLPFFAYPAWTHILARADTGGPEPAAVRAEPATAKQLRVVEAAAAQGPNPRTVQASEPPDQGGRAANPDVRGEPVSAPAQSVLASTPVAARPAAPAKVNPPDPGSQEEPVADAREPQDQAATVYVTKTGAKYHIAGCRELARGSIPMALKEAAGRYSPCSVCRPPLADSGPSPPRTDVARSDRPPSSDEKAPAAAVFRSTVQIRNGTRRGSGTILASVPDETLILTAAHVVGNSNALKVELHRHNLGGPITGLTEGNGWPRLVPATVVAADPAADVAVVRITGMVALPHAARFDSGAKEPAKGEVVTSVGIDRTLFLTQWRTTVQGAALIDVGNGGGPRRFIVTTHYPEHGRSGGGLYRGDGAVVGVCVGQLNPRPGQPRRGVFASVESINRLLHENGLDGALRATTPGTSEARKSRKVR